VSVHGVTESESCASDPPGLSVRVSKSFSARLDGDAVLCCSGEIDPETIPVLRRSLRRVVLLAPARVIVDLSRVSFFDAGAIGEFVRAREASRAAGGDLVLRAPSPFGRRVLGIVGLTDLIADEPEDPTAPGDATSGNGQRRVDDHEPAPADPLSAALDELAGRFSAGTRSSVVMDEAKGLVAEHFAIGIAEASMLLRAFSVAQRTPILAVAEGLMDQSISLTRVAPHRHGEPPGAVAGTDVDGVVGDLSGQG